MISSSPITKIQPKIRFNKFNSNWETVSLKELTNIVGRIGFRGYTVADIVPMGKGAITISPSNIVDSKVDFNKCTYISWDKYEESPEIKIYDGDIIFVKTGSTIGKTAFVRGLNEKATLNPQLVVLKNISIDNKFLFYRMLSRDFRKNVVKIAVGGAIPTLSQVELGKISFRVPSEEEQQKIASFLSSIDDWIENLIQQKLALEKYKKGMMQKIFSQEIRFKDENGKDFPKWEEARLGDIFNILAGGDIHKLQFSQEEDEIHKFPVYANALTNNGLVGYSTTPRILQDSITVTGRGDVGHAVARLGGYTPVVRLLTLIPKNEVSTYFFECVINHSKIFVESTGVPQLTAPQISAYKVRYPTPNEQKKIAEFLISIDNLIELKRNQIDKAEIWKKGLMQKMFI